LAIAAVSPAASAEPLDPGGGLGFDMGCAGSPVANGYLQVSNTTVYDAGRGYGLDRTTDCRDRGTADPLLRDFTNASGYSFLVDLPDGDYHVTVYSGDAIASNRTNVVVEGVDLGQIFSATGQYGSVDAVVTVADGQLNVDASNNGRINAVEVVPVSAPENLHVVNTTLVPAASVELAWDEVPDAASYVVYRGESADNLVQLAETTDPGFVDESVSLGFTYTYAVSMVTGTGVESAQSEPVSVTLRDESQEPPGTPERFSLVETTTRDIALGWQMVDGAVAYYVQRATGAEGPFATVATVSATAYTDEVTPSRTYYYRVFAVGLGGLSDPTPVIASPVTVVAPREMEQLDRAMLAVPTADGVLVSWRMLGTDPPDVEFHLYRDGKPVTSVTGTTNHLDPAGTAESTYQVAALVNGREGALSAPVQPWANAFLDIPLQRPPGGVTPAGEQYVYHANDASAGDLDGDGTYELVLQWEPSNSKDNSQAGYTGETILDGIALDGTLLWRIHFGRNIRAGAHYTQFLVYDLDGDGRAEVVAKTADGTIDGAGAVIGDPDADYRNSNGYVLDGPEFLTVFDGLTGAALATTDYYPPRGTVSDWGDDYGNRVDRFLAGVAYLDGERPSFVMTRGYYTRTVLAAYDWREGELTQRWVFDSDDPGNGAFAGQGNHQLSVADIDADSRDEIIFGQMAVDDDGTGMYSLGFGTGDAMHVSDLDPSRPGFEVFGVHESASSPYGFAFRDAATGEVLWGELAGFDVGRGTAGDIDPRYSGAEGWAVDGAFNSPTGWLYSAAGDLISRTIPPANHMIWWDGDLLREILDHDWDEPLGVGFIGKWDWAAEETTRLLTADGTYSNNGTKGNPTLTADLFGDWREEAIWRTEDSSALRLYATPHPTGHRLPTLMHDPVYRLGVAWQNVGYNQPPHTSYYLGDGMAAPELPHLRTGEVVPATMQLLPPVLVVGEGTPGQVTARVSLPTGVVAADVAAGTVRMVVDGDLVSAESVRAAVGSELIVAFDRIELADRLAGFGGTVELTVTGYLADGRLFTGTGAVRLR
jgi:fibronectin type 3 domain-containing protein